MFYSCTVDTNVLRYLVKGHHHACAVAINFYVYRIAGNFGLWQALNLLSIGTGEI